MYEIFAYQNAQSLAGIFNAIAAIFGSGDYLGAVALVAVFGFIVAFMAYAFQPERLHGWKWLGTVVIVYSIIYVPRVTVQITDKTSGNPPAIVDNVPLGVALFGSMTSQVGNLLTQLFETAFQVIPGPGALPSELAYQQNGLMFGSRLVKYTRNLGFVNPSFRTDLIAFIDNCTKYDLMDGTIDPSLFSSSPDVWSLMSSPNPARLTPITTAPGVSTVVPCDTAYPILNALAQNEVLFLQAKLGQQLNPTLSAAAASAAIGAQITVAYQKNLLADASATAGQIILQNAMINAINDTSAMIGQKTNDPASLLLAMGRAQAVAQINSAWINYGKIAEEALPLIRNVVEAVCYALFPLMVLLLFMTSGMQTLIALKSYVVTLLWIQLWPPIYAILNYVASIASASKLGAAADIGGGLTAMSLQTASAVYSNAISLEAVVGYMVISIPAIAWAAIKGMETIGQAAITGTSSMQGTIGAASGQAALGNVGMGNVSMEQQHLAPTRTSPFFRNWQSDREGHTHHDGAFGTSAVDLFRSTAHLSRRTGAGRTSAAEERASRDVQAARDESVAASGERAAVFAEALAHGQARLDGSRLGSGYSKSEVGEMSDTYNQARGIVRQVAKALKVDDAIAAGLLFQAQGGLAGGYSGSGGRRLAKGGRGTGNGGTEAADGTSVAESGSIGISGNVSGALHQKYGSQVSREIGTSELALSPEQAATLKAFAERYTSDDNFVRAIATDTRDAEERSARNSRSVARTQRASAAFSSAERFAEEIRLGSSQQDGMDADVLVDPRNTDLLLSLARQWDGSPKMAAAMAFSEVAQRGVLSRPTTYADGSDVHWGRNGVGAVHAANLSDPKLNPDIEREHAKMKRQTGSAGVGPNVTPGDLVEQVRSGQAATKGETVRNWNRLEVERVTREEKANADINAVEGPGTKQNPRGTLGTKNVLANDAGGMFVDDAKESVRRVKDEISNGIRDLFK